MFVVKNCKKKADKVFLIKTTMQNKFAKNIFKNIFRKPHTTSAKYFANIEEITVCFYTIKSSKVLIVKTFYSNKFYYS